MNLRYVQVNAIEKEKYDANALFHQSIHSIVAKWKWFGVFKLKHFVNWQLLKLIRPFRVLIEIGKTVILPIKYWFDLNIRCRFILCLCYAVLCFALLCFGYA